MTQVKKDGEDSKNNKLRMVLRGISDSNRKSQDKLKGFVNMNNIMHQREFMQQCMEDVGLVEDFVDLRVGIDETQESLSRDNNAS